MARKRRKGNYQVEIIDPDGEVLPEEMLVVKRVGKLFENTDSAVRWIRKNANNGLTYRVVCVTRLITARSKTTTRWLFEEMDDGPGAGSAGESNGADAVGTEDGGDIGEINRLVAEDCRDNPENGDPA